MALLLILFLIFLLGVSIGSFLNVCIYRLSLEKSILWPTDSRCGKCLQSIRWYDNIPLLSYWILGGRCRACGMKFSFRYFLIELFTGLCLCGLYYLEVEKNIHNIDPTVVGEQRFEAALMAIFIFHSILFCFLLVASFCDFDYQTIPLPLTVTGTFVGLTGSALFPWPWPYPPAAGSINNVRHGLVQGLYAWPVWLPLPSWLQPGGNWQTGLATGLAGFLAGTLILRGVRFLFGLGMGSEYMEAIDPEVEATMSLPRRMISWVQRLGGRALGLGDADLMMMAGSFLGWQPVLVAFFLAPFAGLVVGIPQALMKKSNVLAFGPALAVGSMAACLGWSDIGPRVQQIFLDPVVLGWLVVICVVLMPAFGYLLRLRRMLRPA